MKNVLMTLISCLMLTGCSLLNSTPAKNDQLILNVDPSLMITATPLITLEQYKLEQSQSIKSK